MTEARRILTKLPYELSNEKGKSAITIVIPEKNVR